MAKAKWIKVVESYKKLQNVSKVARKYNIDRSTVYSYLRLAENKGIYEKKN
jgi:transposase-like protein